GVRDGGVDDRRAAGFAGGGHTLGGQRGDGDDRIVPVGNDLGADLGESGGVVLAVEHLVFDGRACGGFGVQFRLDGGADLVQAGVVHLLDDGDPVSGLPGRGRLGSGGGNVGSPRGAAGGEGGHQRGGRQNGKQFFHKAAPFLCRENRGAAVGQGPGPVSSAGPALALSAGSFSWSYPPGRPWAGKGRRPPHRRMC